MDDQRIYSSESKPENAATQLASLQRQQDALWVELRSEDDPDRRMALLSQFSENRSAIAQLSKSDGESIGPSAGSFGYRVELIDDAAPDGFGALSFNDDGELVSGPSSEPSIQQSQGDIVDLDRSISISISILDPIRSISIRDDLDPVDDNDLGEAVDDNDLRRGGRPHAVRRPRRL